MSTVLITGGSKGIGLELAKNFAHDKHSLVLVARSQTELKKSQELLSTLGAPAVHIFDLDLSQPEATNKLASLLQKKKLAIDVLINNAGFGDHGPFAKAEKEKLSGMIQLNITTLTLLTRLLLPDMLARGHGQVINIASTAAFIPGPYMAVYYATKAFVLSFSEALAEELRNTPITVTAICPGPTVTNFAKQANMDTASMFQPKNAMNSELVAKQAYQAIQQKRTVAVIGTKNSLLPIIVRFLPRKLVTRFVAHVQK